MNTKEKNLPVFVEDDTRNDFHAPTIGECSLERAENSEYNAELNVGSVKLKGSAKSSDNSSSVIGGVLAGGAVAIGAVAVTLTLLGVSKNN